MSPSEFMYKPHFISLQCSAFLVMQEDWIKAKNKITLIILKYFVIELMGFTAHRFLKPTRFVNENVKEIERIEITESELIRNH